MMIVDAVTAAQFVHAWETDCKSASRRTWHIRSAHESQVNILRSLGERGMGTLRYQGHLEAAEHFDGWLRENAA